MYRTRHSAEGIAFVVFDSAMAARRACGLSGEMFKADIKHACDDDLLMMYCGGLAVGNRMELVPVALILLSNGQFSHGFVDVYRKDMKRDIF